MNALITFLTSYRRPGQPAPRLMAMPSHSRAAEPHHLIASVNAPIGTTPYHSLDSIKLQSIPSLGLFADP